MLAVNILLFRVVSTQTPLVSDKVTNSKGSLVIGSTVKAKCKV